MTLTVLTSAAGAPGVTTTALGLTLHWPDSCLLVDGDHQQAVLTGYLQGSRVTDNGIINVINAARIHPNVREAVWRQSIPLPDDDPAGRRRLLLPGLTNAQTTAALHQSWPQIATALRDLDDAGIDIVLDYGRLGPAGIHPAILDAASHLLLMTKPTMQALGACHWAARRLTDQTATSGSSCRTGLLLVRRPALSLKVLTGTDPTDRGYSTHEIEEFLPLKVTGTIVHDPTNAHLLSDGGTRTAKFTRSAYATSLIHLAQTLAGSAHPDSPQPPATEPHAAESHAADPYAAGPHGGEPATRPTAGSPTAVGQENR